MTSKVIEYQDSTINTKSIEKCYECPSARHLNGNRYACTQNIRQVTYGNNETTQECREAITNFKFKNHTPGELPNFKGLNSDQICKYINLEIEILDDGDNGYIISDHENAVEVTHHNIRVGYLKRENNLYYSSRIPGKYYTDPYEIALCMIHEDYLYQIPEEIIEKQELIPDYN